MHIPVTRPAGAALASALLLSLTACGEADTSAETEAPSSERESTSTAQQRVVVASDAGVVVVDADTLETLDSFATPSRPKLQLAGDDRHVFTLASDAGSVGVVDAGAWSEAHGDHSHHYVVAPSELETTFDRGTSYHAVSDDERSVVWFDDDASFVSFDTKELEDDEVDAKIVETGGAHHGVAAPLANGGWLASVAEGDHAIGVKVLDADGATTKTIEDCHGLHGETHVGDDYAFGCEDGVLTVDPAGEASKIVSPLEGAGTGALYPGEGEILVGDLRGDDAPEAAATSLALYDTAAGTARVVDLGVEFSTVTRYEDQAFALGTDGALHVVDVTTGEVVDSIPVTDAWEKDEDWKVPTPQVAQAEGVAYVTDPSDSTITSWDLTSGAERGEAKLKDVPTSLLVTNG